MFFSMIFFGFFMNSVTDTNEGSYSLWDQPDPSYDPNDPYP